jgi:uroporphyrinogen-III synthase
MRIVVTRPAREAREWAAFFASHLHQPVALPLIDIAPALDRQALANVWKLALDEAIPGQVPYKAAMFVSANAVDHFFAARPAKAAGLPFARAWAPGPGTGNALRANGMPPAQIDEPQADVAQFDSEALWPLVAQQITSGSRVLVVRGGDASGQAQGRDWLAAQVREAGGECHDLVAYVRRIAVWTPEQKALASEAASDGSVWLFSSSEAVANLAALLPAQDWSSARAVATHERISQAARHIGFGRVRTSRPQRADVLASIELPQ